MRNPYSYAYTAILLVFTVLSACKKEINSNLSSNTPASPSKDIKSSSNATGKSMALTHEESTILKKLIKERMIRGVDDFWAKVDSLKLVSAQKTSGNIGTSTARVEDGVDYNPAEDDIDEALMTSDELGDLQYIDITEGFIRYKSQFQRDLVFTIRGNTMKVIVPFQYDWKESGYQWYVAHVYPDAQSPQLLPTGAFWGEVTANTFGYLNGGSGDPYMGCPVSAFGAAQEKRTQIISTTGAIKVSTNLDLEVFKAGAEVEAGFTVQTAYYIYNQYTMTADGNIFGGASQPIPSYCRFVGNVVCVDNGVLKNQ